MAAFVTKEAHDDMVKESCLLSQESGLNSCPHY